MNNTGFKAYFYNGFQKPKLIATNVTELTQVAVSDNYRGDITKEMLDVIQQCKNLVDLTFEMKYFNIYINPTIKTLRTVNRQWFDEININCHLEDFIGR